MKKEEMRYYIKQFMKVYMNILLSYTLLTVLCLVWFVTLLILWYFLTTFDFAYYIFFVGLSGVILAPICDISFKRTKKYHNYSIRRIRKHYHARRNA